MTSGENPDEKCVLTNISFNMNIPEALPAKSYIVFRRSLLSQDFDEEFYTISTPYDSGAKDQKIYSFKNQAGNLEYLALYTSDVISAGTKALVFKNMRNTAANSVQTSYFVEMFNLNRLILDENLGMTTQLLATGGIKPIDQIPADIEVNPFIFFTFGNLLQIQNAQSDDLNRYIFLQNIFVSLRFSRFLTIIYLCICC